jgi:hypothetical protein
VWDKTRQDKTRHDKTRRDETRQDKTRTDKTRQDTTRQKKTRQQDPSKVSTMGGKHTPHNHFETAAFRAHFSRLFFKNKSM